MNFESMTKEQLLEYLHAEQKKTKYLKSLEKESLDIDKLYQTSLDIFINLEKVDMALVYIIDEKTNCAVLKAHIGTSEEYVKKAGEIPYPKGATWKVINDKKRLNLYDLQNNKIIGEAGRKLGHSRALGIPIMYDNSVKGVIWYGSYEKGKFSDQEVDLYSSIADKIGTSIARAKLYDDLSKSHRYQEIVSNITSYIHQSIIIDDVMNNTVKALVENVEGVDNAAIYMLEQDVLLLKAYDGLKLPKWFMEVISIMSNKRGFIWKTILDKKNIYVPDADNDNSIGPAGKKLGIKSYVSMPITNQGIAIGVISVSSFKKNVFNNDDIDLLDTVTKQIEIAIINAQRAEELKQAHSKLELRVEERTAQLKVINEELQKLALHLQSVREEELLKISRELHDDLGQVLTSINIEFSSLSNKLQSNDAKKITDNEISSIGDTIHLAIRKVQKISSELRPAILETLGLIPAIEWHVQEFKHRTNLDCDFVNRLNGTSFNDKESIAIYRILQESTTNILRHANATKVDISLYKRDRFAVLEVVDNGVGINESKIDNYKSIGIQGMRERAIVLGGKLYIKGIANQGTTIKLTLPILDC